MKKILSIMLMLVVICMSAVVVSAENDPTLTVNAPEQAAIGSSFDVTVDLSNNPGIISMRFKVNYDSEVLELTGVTDTVVLNKFVTPSPTISSPYTLYWSDGLATTNNSANGAIITLHFTVLAESVLDGTEISIEFLESSDADLSELSFSTVSDSVEIIEEPVTDPVTDPVTEPVTDPVVDTDTDVADTDTDVADTDTNAADTTDVATETTGGDVNPDTPATGDAVLFVSLASLIALAAGFIVYGKKRHN